jgi:hypothetical protein
MHDGTARPPYIGAHRGLFVRRWRAHPAATVAKLDVPACIMPVSPRHGNARRGKARVVLRGDYRPLCSTRGCKPVPITHHKYDPRSGESVYTLAEGGETFNLAVEPEGNNRNRLTLWQGERYDEGNHLVAQSDPLRFSYTDDREKFYAVVGNVFGEKPWIREALTLIARMHPKWVQEALERFRKERADDPEYQALPGHEPTIYRTPDGYRLEASGANLVPISNFTGRIVEDVLVNDGSGETVRYFTVEARVGEQRTQFDVPSQGFDGLSWVPKHLGALASVESPRLRHLVAKAFRLESHKSLREVHAYGHTGWIEVEGRWGYLHAGGAIVGPGAPAFSGRVVLSGKLARRKFPEVSINDPEALKEAVRASFELWDLVADEIAIPLILSAYRAVLGEVDYSLHLAGSSGLGKTTLAHLAVSHFGARLGDKDQANFRSTANSIELEAFALKDQLLLLDDYLGNSKHRKILAFIARNAANNSGRARLASDGTLRGDKPPRALVVTTGEDLPVGESLTARMLVLRMPEGQGLDLSKGAPINTAQGASREGTYALAMAGFVNWFAPRYGEFQATIEKRRNQYGYEVSDRVRHNRTPAIYGNLMIALEEWLDFATEIGAIDEERCTALAERAKGAVLAAIQAQGEYLGSADPVERYRDLLREALASGNAHLRAPGEEPGPGVHLGWSTPEGTYLYPDVSLSLAKHMAEAVGDPLPFSGQAMNKRLLERGRR